MCLVVNCELAFGELFFFSFTIDKFLFASLDARVFSFSMVKLLSRPADSASTAKTKKSPLAPRV